MVVCSREWVVYETGRVFWKKPVLLQINVLYRNKSIFGTGRLPGFKGPRAQGPIDFPQGRRGNFPTHLIQSINNFIADFFPCPWRPPSATMTAFFQKLIISVGKAVEGSSGPILKNLFSIRRPLSYTLWAFIFLPLQHKMQRTKGQIGLYKGLDLTGLCSLVTLLVTYL